MALPTLSEKHIVTIEVEWVAGSGVFEGWCGCENLNIDRTTETETVKVSDCADRASGKVDVVDVTGLTVSVSGTGYRSIEIKDKTLAWYASSGTKKIRIFHTDAVSGQIEYETGDAILAKLANGNIYDGVITEDFEMPIRNYGTVVKP